jgi:hypothetical protein
MRVLNVALLWVLMGILFLPSCNTPDTTNQQYLNSIKRNLKANKKILTDIYTKPLIEQINQTHSFLINFTLQCSDTLDKPTAEKLLQLSEAEKNLIWILNERARLVKEISKMENQLNKLELLIVSKSQNEEIIFNGLCHEFQSVKQLTITTKKLTQLIQQNLKLVENNKTELEKNLRK